MGELLKKGIILAAGLVATISGYCALSSKEISPLQQSRVHNQVNSEENYTNVIQRTEFPSTSNRSSNKTSLELILDGEWGQDKEVILVPQLAKSPDEFINKKTESDEVLFSEITPSNYALYVQSGVGYAADNIDVKKGERNVVHLRPNTFKDISIFIQDSETKNPVNGASVTLENVWASPIKSKGVTQRGGILTLPAAPIRQRSISGEEDPLYSISVKAKGYSDEFLITQINEGFVTVGIDPEKIFEFKVMGEDNSEVANPSFELYSQGFREPVNWDIKNIFNEKYQIRGLPSKVQGFNLVGSEEYQLKISAPNFPENIFYFKSKTTANPEAFRLARDKEIKGVFVDQDGQALSGVKYHIKFTNGPEVKGFDKWSESDIYGNFDIKGLGLGNYTIRALKQGYIPTSDIVRVESGFNPRDKKIYLNKDG